MSLQVGDVYVDDIQLFDSGGVAITGAAASIAVTLNEKPDGSPFSSTVVITESGSGYYEATWTLTDAGIWRISYTYPGPPVQNFAPTVVFVEEEQRTARVGDVYVDDIQLFDSGGAAITGAASLISISRSEKPGDTPFASTVVITESGSGYYEATWTLTDPGVWRIAYSYPGPPIQNFSPTVIFVEEDEDAEEEALRSYKLRDIRAAVARKCNDFVIARATQNSASTTVFIDALNLYENNDHFRGSEVWFKNDAGTAQNRGLKVRCTSSSLSDTSLSLGPGLAIAPFSGDEVWIYNIGGSGTRINIYDKYINDCIRALGSSGCIAYTEDLDDLFDVDVAWVDIPASFTHVSGLQYYDDDDVWKEVPGHAFAIDRVRKAFAFNRDYAQYLDGKSLRVIGLTDHPELIADNDATDIDFEWLTNDVAGDLLLQRREQVMKTLGGQYKNYAATVRGKASPLGLLDNNVRVR